MPARRNFSEGGSRAVYQCSTSLRRTLLRSRHCEASEAICYSRLRRFEFSHEIALLHSSQLLAMTIHVPTVQVSDTTKMLQRTTADNKKYKQYQTHLICKQ